MEIFWATLEIPKEGPLKLEDCLHISMLHVRYKVQGSQHASFCTRTLNERANVGSLLCLNFHIYGV